MVNLIWTAAAVLFILWLLGFSIQIGGGLSLALGASGDCNNLQPVG